MSSRSEIARSGSSFNFTTCSPSSAPSRTSRCRCASHEFQWPKRAPVRRSYCNGSDWANACLIVRACCRGVNSSGWLSRGPSSCGRHSCWPTSPRGNLDEQTADSLHLLLREMHSAYGLTSVIATHNPRLAGACDRVLRLEAGRLTAEQVRVVRTFRSAVAGEPEGSHYARPWSPKPTAHSSDRSPEETSDALVRAYR